MPFLRRFPFVACAALFLISCGSAEEEESTPPSLTPDRTDWATSRKFEADGKTFSPADFESVQLSYRFSLDDKTANGTAEITFRPTENGYAYFLSDPGITSARLNGKDISIEDRQDPDKLNTLKVISAPLRKGRRNKLLLSFVLPASRVTLEASGVSFLTSMSDLGRGNYLEAYAPSSFEHDAYALSMDLNIGGGTPESHSIFANGAVRKKSATSWEVKFPSHFTSSSVYLHLSHSPFYVRESVYEGKKARIPITVYSREENLANQALAALPAIFAELESTYGPYGHEAFVAYIAGRGGMEYSGATITSVGALAHELTHSWFARGVMPSSGSSGWIDEAIASWRDFGYFRASASGVRAPTNLGRISAFQRFTPSNCYVDGRALLAEFDFLLAGQGGLRPILADLYSVWEHRSIRTEDFKAFLEKKSGLDFSGLFARYVYNADSSFPGDGVADARGEELSRYHPELSAEEIEKLR